MEQSCFFLLKNPDFLLQNLDFLLKNVDFYNTTAPQYPGGAGTGLDPALWRAPAL